MGLGPPTEVERRSRWASAHPTARRAAHGKNGMYEIEINDSQSRIAADLDRLRSVAVDVLRHEGVAAAEVSVALIDGETMRRLNREHLGHDYDTDVLSFLLDASGPEVPEPDAPRGAGKTLDGEVLISTDVAARAAEEFGWSVESEVILYLVHGLLHLTGYDDLTDDERAVMRERECFHLARWGLTPVYAETDGRGGPATGPAA
ncbi:MAG TPA: rRNA maturation RNase YbeY, partial [Planctomycetaceae bacterium]